MNKRHSTERPRRCKSQRARRHIRWRSVDVRFTIFSIAPDRGIELRASAPSAMAERLYTGEIGVIDDGVRFIRALSGEAP